MLKIFKRKTQDILTSITDIGLLRKKNEDYVTTLIHPSNKKIKLLAVADGVGGCPKGEVASKFVIKSLEKWFVNENKKSFESISLLSKKIYKEIVNINNELYKKEYNSSKCGTTLTCAIITEKDTIICNIGDSRAYVVKDNEIKQITKDDSLVWQYYEQGILTKDELRFHVNNSLITKCIGHMYNVKPSIIKIENNNYNCLLLLTDGVTDCLSDEKIKFIVNKNTGQDIAKQLINEAIYHKQYDNIPKGFSFNNIVNGKDNASVALYIKHT